MTIHNETMEQANLGVTISVTPAGDVLIAFDQPVASVELNPQDAQNFALNLLDQVEEAMKPRSTQDGN